MSQRRAEGWSAVGGGLRGLGSSEPIVKFRWWLERVQGVAVSEVIRGKKCGRCTLVESLFARQVVLDKEMSSVDRSRGTWHESW
jgi:hypothetical protein